MKEKYEVDNNLTQEKTEYYNEKLLTKLKLVSNEFQWRNGKRSFNVDIE